MGQKWEMIWLAILSIALVCITASRGIGAGLIFAIMDVGLIAMYANHFRKK